MAPQSSKMGRVSVGNSGEVCSVACLDYALVSRAVTYGVAAAAGEYQRFSR